MSNRIIKDTIAITVITLVAGLALGVVQDITADPIAKQEAQAKQDAYKAVFADADSFETVDVDADLHRVPLDLDAADACSEELLLQKLADIVIFHQGIAETTVVGIPTGIPILDNAHSQAVGINFLSHYLTSS